MVATDPRDVGFRPTDSEILPEYQPLSRLSLASLIAALLSPVALVHPLLWIVPVIAVLLAILALRTIDRFDGELRGSGLARTALVVALLFGSWAVVWNMSYQYLVGRQARHYSQAWLELIKKGQLYEAHQLSMSLQLACRGNQSLEVTYKESDDAPEAVGTGQGSRLGRDRSRFECKWRNCRHPTRTSSRIRQCTSY